MTKRTMVARAKMVKAMDYIAQCCNDEDLIMHWYTLGVADCDIMHDEEIDNLDTYDYYVEDENFAELMGLFLNIMKHAYKTGLYCTNVLSKDDVGE